MTTSDHDESGSGGTTHEIDTYRVNVGEDSSPRLRAAMEELAAALAAEETGDVSGYSMDSLDPMANMGIVLGPVSIGIDLGDCTTKGCQGRTNCGTRCRKNNSTGVLEDIEF